MQRIEIVASDPTYLIWVGDGTKNDGNATFYIKNNGSAYFAGALSAGALTNEMVGNEISTTAVLETGAFQTNGNTKQVNFSMQYTQTGHVATNMAQSLSVIMRLDRKYNGGAYSQVDSMTVTGAITTEWDGEFGMYLTNWHLGGGKTFTDTMAGTGTFEYRLRLASASGSWPWFIGGNNGTQTMTIRCVEN